jgi:hypothetical protein
MMTYASRKSYASEAAVTTNISSGMLRQPALIERQ